MINFKSKFFEDSVDVTIHTRNFGAEDVSLARVQRKTTYVGNIIDKVLVKSKTFDEQTLFHVANLFHNAIIDLLKEGKAVELFDLGVMYLKPEKSMKTASLSDVPNMTVSFSPSVQSINAVKDVQVGSDVTTSKEPALLSVKNVTNKNSSSFKPNSVMRIKGKFLKVAGAEEQTGVFLVPSSVIDFSVIGENWIQIKESDLTDNTNTQIEFTLPQNISTGNYYLLIKTAFCSGRLLKTPRTGVYSEAIVVEE